MPVWNGLTDEFHPTQILADVLTMRSICPKPLSRWSLCYLGDGGNNMGNSLMVGCAKLGIDFRMAAPERAPRRPSCDDCRGACSATGASITSHRRRAAGGPGADFLYTDVWVSMGDPESAWDERIELLRPFQVNRTSSRHRQPGVKFLHCLPAFHNRETTKGEEVFQKYGLDGMEVTDDVFESEPRSSSTRRRTGCTPSRR